MSNIITHPLPLIKTSETEELLSSVKHLLGKEGFQVIMLNAQLHERYEEEFGLDNREEMALDALAILRFVRKNWDKKSPVMIEQAARYSTFALSSIAA